MIATGARCPKWARKVSCAVSIASTVSLTTAKSIPANSMAWEGRRRQASTKEGAANEATSSTLPGPDTRSSARATDGLASCTTSGRLRADLLDAQCRLQRVDLVDLDTDHRGGARQPGLLEPLATVRVAADMGHAPVVQGPPTAGIGVVVDHDDPGAAQMELLHGAQPHALEPAHDHVTLHALGVLPIHQGMLPGWFATVGCRRVKCRRFHPSVG